MKSAPTDTSPGGPLASIIIPAFNRLPPLRATLDSAFRAADAVGAEIILVDDGSTVPLSESLADYPFNSRIVHLRQVNQGAIVARLLGLEKAQGSFVVFLDSDDLIHPEKLSVSIEALRREQADLVYDDMARATPASDGWTFTPAEALRRATEPADFYLRVQPVPHSPTYRRSYLLRHLREPLIAPNRAYDPAGDVWLYYNLAAFPAKIIKLDRALTAIGVHEEERYSRHWERIGVSALKVMEAFAEACPDSKDLLSARILAGECAFDSWRRLPRGFNRDYERRTLAIWQRAPHGPVHHLGGHFFQILSRVLGPAGAGRLLRLRNKSYEACRTIDQNELENLMAS